MQTSVKSDQYLTSHMHSTGDKQMSYSRAVSEVIVKILFKICTSGDFMLFIKDNKKKKKQKKQKTFRLGTAVPVSILRKSISGRHRPVRVADGPMTARCRFT